MVTARSLCNANDNDNWSHRTQTSAAPLHRVRRYVHLSWLQLVGSRERERERSGGERLAQPQIHRVC